MPSTEGEDQTKLRDELQQIPGVERAILDTELRRILLLLRSGVPAHRVERVALDVVADTGYELTVVYRPEHRDRQRVRFVELNRDELPDQQVSYRVTLEWAGKEVHGEGKGEKGDAIELRTAASAALAAVLKLAPPDLQVRIAGVKQVRAFDAELIVISMYRAGAEPHNLVGAVVTGGDPSRAAAAAVLSALNRLLGNYLVT